MKNVYSVRFESTRIAGSLACLLLLGGPSLHADSVNDYGGFGVRQHHLYAFPTLISQVVLNPSSSNPALDKTLLFTANHLATDAARNRLLFTASGGVTQLYAWDFASDSYYALGIISNSASATDIHHASGGAAFYNGAYYFFDDVNTADPLSYGLTRVTFNLDGTVNATEKPYGNGNSAIGGLGDIAISPEGILYIHSTDRALWKLDLNNPLATYQLIRTDTGAASSQLFFDPSGRLLGRGNNGVGWFVFDLTTGATTTLSTPNAQIFDDLSDAPNVAPAPIPEPATVLFVLMGSAALLLQRRLRSRL